MDANYHYLRDLPGNKKNNDTVYNPHHYAQYEIQPLEFIMKNKLSFWLGNVIKYAMRADEKNGEEDLDKAISYLRRRKAELRGESVIDVPFP